LNLDLRDFIKTVENEDPEKILRISTPVKDKYEITSYALELEKIGKTPILIFDKVGDYKMPVVCNIFASRKRYAIALGVSEDLLMQEWIKLGEIEIEPIELNYGPIKEEVKTGNEVDLSKLPILTHFKEDAGPYITSGIIIAKHPITGVRNASIHRMQLKGKNKLGVSLHSRRHLWEYQRIAEEQGRDLEVAVVIGANPLFYFGTGLWRGSIKKDEFKIGGGFYKEALEIVKCETVNLEIPANAEIVLEGKILHNVKEDEGPFAEFTGYLSGNSTRNVIEVSAILQRKDAIYQDLVSGLSLEHVLLLAIPQEARIFETVSRVVPTVKAVSYPWSGVGKVHCYISIKKVAEGQPYTAIFSAFAEDLALKLVIIVDEDIDVHNEKEVLWALANRLQGDKGIFVVPGCMGMLLDPSANNGVTAKVGIDATKNLLHWTAKEATIPKDISNMVKETIIKNFKA
jgi:UbiD family decarboxylase